MEEAPSRYRPRPKANPSVDIGDHVGPRTRPPARSWLQPLTLLLTMVVLAWVGLLQLTTPEPASATAPETDFSAARAMAYLDQIAPDGSSRAIGMPGHDRARDYLARQLTLMGLQPELHSSTSVLRFVGADSFGAGTVTNVIARLPGSDSTGAVVLNAHYDGGSTGPAAGDNGAGVAAVLETVRAIRAGPPLTNDLVIVFSDGEENGDLGSAAFNQDHPWAQDVRLAVNFEAQGSGGPAILYATSNDNGWLTEQYFAVAPSASAYSLLPQLVQRLPGMRLACDLEDYLLKDSDGLGFVFASDTPAYHSAQDSLANIDRGSIQQEGENTLAVLQHFGNADLVGMPREADRVFFTVLPGVVAHYGGGLVVPFALLATLLTLGVIAGGVRRRLLSIGGAAVGVATLLVGSLATTVLVALLWFAIRATNGDYRVLMVGTYQARLFTVALSLAAVALMAGMYWLLGRRFRADDLYAGALLAWLLPTWWVGLVLPGASYLTVWPLVFALLPLAWSVVRTGQDPRSWLHLVLLVGAVVPAFVLIPGTAYQVVALLNRLDYFSTLTGGFPMLGLWAVFVAPLVGLYLRQVGLLSELAGPSRRWAAPAGIGVLALALIGYANLVSGFDAGHPRPNHIAYEVDGTTGEARWVSLDHDPDAWTEQFLTAVPAATVYELAPGAKVPALATAAPRVPIALPSTEIVSDSTANGGRTVTFRILSPRAPASMEAVIGAPGAIRTAAVNGRSLDLADYGPAGSGRLQFGFAGMPPAGIEVVLGVQSDGPITLDLSETDYGLPATPGMTVRPRPDDTMPATGLPLDATVIRSRGTI